MIDVTILAGYDPVYSSRTASRLLRATLREDINQPSELVITLPGDHDALPGLMGEYGALTVVGKSGGDEVLRFEGRVVAWKQDTNLTTMVTAESRLACLADSVIPPFHFPEDVAGDPAYQAAAASGNVVEYFLGWILAQHNAQTQPHQHVSLGSVTVTDPNNYIARSSDTYLTTADVIKTRLLGTALGGYWREGADGVSLDYLSEATEQTRSLELGRDLTEISVSRDWTDAYSVIIPVGADGLTISSLPDGSVAPDIEKTGDRLYSVYGSRLYGSVARVVEWPDVTLPARLQSKAAAKLAAASAPPTVSVSAIDRAWVDSSLDLLRVGESYPVTSYPHGLYELPMRLSGLTRDLLKPGKSTINFGQVQRTQTGAVAALQASR